MPRHETDEDTDDDNEDEESDHLPGMGGSDSSEDDPDDPEQTSTKRIVEKHQMIRILVLGASGSGKTTLVSRLLSTMVPRNKRIWIVNQKRSNTEKVPDSWEPVSWKRAANAEGVALVCEDLISLNAAQRNVMSHLLSHASHHRKVSPLVAISHGIHGHKLYSLLSAFNFVYVAARPSSAKCARSVLIELHFPKTERDQHLKTLLSGGQEFTYLMIDVERRTVQLCNLASKTPLELLLAEKNTDAQKCRLSAPALLSLLPHAQIATVLFELILAKLPNINPVDLTFEARTRAPSSSSSSREKTKTKKKTIKIVDFLFAMLSEDENTVPDESAYRVYRYLTTVKSVNFPLCFIKSPHFRRRLQGQQQSQPAPPLTSPPPPPTPSST